MTERKTGTWLDRSVYETKGTIEEVQSARCSVCNRYLTTPYRYYFDYYNYCPCCGAKMDKQEAQNGR